MCKPKLTANCKLSPRDTLGGSSNASHASLVLVAVHVDLVRGIGVDIAMLALEKELVVAVDVGVVVLALEEELVVLLSDTDVLLAVDV